MQRVTRDRPSASPVVTRPVGSKQEKVPNTSRWHPTTPTLLKWNPVNAPNAQAPTLPSNCNTPQTPPHLLTQGPADSPALLHKLTPIYPNHSCQFFRSCMSNVLSSCSWELLSDEHLKIWLFHFNV